MSWFVIRTKPREEKRACENLENQAFEYYCPWLTLDNGKREPLFPGYVFLHDASSEKAFASVRSTRGVLGFVRFGLQFARANDSLIESLRGREAEFQGIERFKKNDRVFIKSGPFSGLEAVYQCKSGTERSIILLKLLNQTNEIAVQTDLLEHA